MKLTFKIVFLTLSALLLAPDVPAATPASMSTLTAPHSAASKQIDAAYGKLPLSFEANQGQTDPQVKFLSRGSGYTLALTSTEAVLVLRKAAALGTVRDHAPEEASGTLESQPTTHEIPAVLRMKLLGANTSPRVIGRDALAGKVNYLIGNDPSAWRTQIPTYAKVEYQSVYPGVDLIYYGNQRQLEYDFVIRPGADHTLIRLAFEGSLGPRIDERGDLLLPIGGGEVRVQRPFVYQNVDGAKAVIDGRYILIDKLQIGFQVAEYDRRLPLVIDPVLSFASYIGGAGGDAGHSITVDSAGNAYLTGSTDSDILPPFPPPTPLSITASPFQGSRAGLVDAFVLKLSPTGALEYATYLGGAGNDIGWGVAVNPGCGSSCDAYVIGTTESSGDFPLVNPSQLAFGGGITDAFVARLNDTGSALVYSTYLGGAGADVGFGVAVDRAGNAYLTGGSDPSVDFPGPTPGGLASSISFGTRAGQDIFVTKLPPLGSDYVWSHIIAGPGQERGSAVAVDPSCSVNCDAYIAGFTDLLSADGDAFVAKLHLAGGSETPTLDLEPFHVFGGTGQDFAHGIAVTANCSDDCDAYVAGHTGSSDLPGPAGQPATKLGAGAPGSSIDAFVTKFNITEGSANIIYSTYLGGGGNDFALGVALDASGHAYATGMTRSVDFPTLNASQLSLRGTVDAFAAKLDTTGSALVYSTYLGGADPDSAPEESVESANSIAVDAYCAVDCAAYVIGATNSTNFPTASPLQAAYGGGFLDAFVAKLGRLPTPREQVGILIDEVELLVARGVLMPNNAHSLIVKLHAAIDQLDKGHTNAAIRKLNDFVNRLEALINSSKILPEQGSPLITAANEIVSRLRG